MSFDCLRAALTLSPQRGMSFDRVHVLLWAKQNVCVPLLPFSKVVSGQQLPKLSKKEGSIVDPLVRVEIYGVPQDQSKQETKHIDNNGE